MNMLITLVIVCSLPQTATQLYNEGNRYYTQAEFHNAIRLYEEASRHASNGALQYNLGNAYFKAGRIGKAIINYHRAHFLSPRDPDIIHNLNYARSYRVDKTRTSGSPITTFLSSAFTALSYREAQIAATVFFVIMSALVSLSIITRKKIFVYAALIAGALFMLAFISWQAWVNIRNARNAVIIAPEVNALSGPGEEYKHILVLHDGAEVRIREARQDYVLIQLPGGLGGWVEKSSLEEVF